MEGIRRQYSEEFKKLKTKELKNMYNVELLEKIATTWIDENKKELTRLAKYIWENPEIGYQEIKASNLLTSKLKEGGFFVTKKFSGIGTAFKGVKKGISESPIIALLAEYDALPQLGHACGHNLSGVASVGAALALGQVMDELEGTLMVIGTPAEEGTVENAGGKVIMIENNVFDDIDVAIMSHADGYFVIDDQLPAREVLEVYFIGKSAHAGGSPEKGINAMNAAVIAWNAINALRQHLDSRIRVSGIMYEGGKLVNTVPEKSILKLSLRAPSNKLLANTSQKVKNCIKAGALATDCKYNIKNPCKTYETMINNKVLSKLFINSCDKLGILVEQTSGRCFSTDMGNVSNIVPSLHPYYKIGSRELVGHTPEFREASYSEEGFNGMISAAKAMAMTIIEYLGSKSLQEKVKDEFNNMLYNGSSSKQ